MVESSRRSAIAAARHRSELCDRVSRRKPVLRGRHLKARVGGQRSWQLINSRWSADISLVELWQKRPEQMEMTKLQMKPRLDADFKVYHTWWHHFGWLGVTDIESSSALSFKSEKEKKNKTLLIPRGVINTNLCPPSLSLSLFFSAVPLQLHQSQTSSFSVFFSIFFSPYILSRSELVRKRHRWLYEWLTGRIVSPTQTIHHVSDSLIGSMPSEIK